MPRKTHIKQYGTGGKTRGRHKHHRSKETKIWNQIVASGKVKRVLEA